MTGQMPVLPPSEQSENTDLQREINRLAQIDLTDIDRGGDDQTTMSDSDTETADKMRSVRKTINHCKYSGTGRKAAVMISKW